VKYRAYTVQMFEGMSTLLSLLLRLEDGSQEHKRTMISPKSKRQCFRSRYRKAC